MDSITQTANARLFEIAERVLPGAGLGGYALAEDIRFVFAEGRGARMRRDTCTAFYEQHDNGQEGVRRSSRSF